MKTLFTLALAALLCDGEEPVTKRAYVPPPVLVEADLSEVPLNQVRTVRICIKKYWDADTPMCLGKPLVMTVEDARWYALVALTRLEDEARGKYIAEICELMPGRVPPKTLAERRKHCELPKLKVHKGSS